MMIASFAGKNSSLVESLNYVANGDSITQYGEVPYPTTVFNAFVDTTDKYLTNVAAAGRSSTILLSGLQVYLTANYRPGYTNILSIMVGVNDIATDVPNATIISNILASVVIGVANDFTVYIFTTTPFKVGGESLAQYDIDYANTLLVNEDIRVNASSSGYTVIDIANTEKYNYQDCVYDIDIYLDGVHMTYSGYAYIGNYAYDIISQTI